MCSAGSAQDSHEGESNLARLFASGTAENRAVTEESRSSHSSAPKLLSDAQVSFHVHFPHMPLMSLVA